jgi:predicted phosphodiesterase
MSQLALISDVHGNGVALDAVLAELARRDIEDIVCLGDVAAGGPQPRQVVGRLRDLRCQLVRGNADTWLIDGLPAGRSDETRRLDEVVAWTHTQLAPDDVEYLAALPLRLRVTTGGLRLFCFHGSPRADIDALLATTPECELDELFADAQEADVLAGGHTLWVPKTRFRLQISFFGLSDQGWHLVRPASSESRFVALFEARGLAPVALVWWLVVSSATTVGESGYRFWLAPSAARS